MFGKGQDTNESCFSCKHDVWLGILIWLTIGMAFYNSYINNAPGAIKGMVGFIILFMGWIWFRTIYLVREGLLITWSGPFRNKVPIQYISSISGTRNILFSPSFSIRNALLIQVGNKRIVVSPRNKKGFIEALCQENQKIQVDHDVYK